MTMLLLLLRMILFRIIMMLSVFMSDLSESLCLSVCACYSKWNEAQHKSEWSERFVCQSTATIRLKSINIHILLVQRWNQSKNYFFSKIKMRSFISNPLQIVGWNAPAFEWKQKTIIQRTREENKYVQRNKHTKREQQQKLKRVLNWSQFLWAFQSIAAAWVQRMEWRTIFCSMPRSSSTA